MNNHMIISVAAKKAINKEEQPIVEQTFTLTGVTLGKANEHKDKIKADIASALSVSMHVNHLTAVKVQTIIWVINATTTVYAAMLPVYAHVS